MIRSTSTGNLTAKTDDSSSSSSSQQVVPSRIVAGPLSCPTSFAAIDNIVLPPLPTLDTEDDDDERPFLEDDGVDTLNPALNAALVELRTCLKAVDSSTKTKGRKGGGVRKGKSSPKEKEAASCNKDEEDRQDDEDALTKLAESWNAVGLIRIHMQQKFDEARKCHLRALDIYKKCTKRHKKDSSCSSDRSTSATIKTSTATTTPQTTTKPDPNQIAMATTLKDLGFCYEKLNQHQLAIKTYQDAVQIFQEQNVSQDNLLLNATLRSISRLSPSRR